MKNPLQKYFTLFMAFVVLMASTGFGLIEHSCMMRGKSLQIAAISKVCKGCPGTQTPGTELKTPVIKKTNCCKDQASFEKVDVVSSTSQLVAKILKSITEGLISAVRLPLTLLVEWLLPSSESSFSTVSFSSRFHGRSMLSFVQTFRI
jgi:hypothetical protein